MTAITIRDNKEVEVKEYRGYYYIQSDNYVHILQQSRYKNTEEIPYEINYHMYIINNVIYDSFISTLGYIDYTLDKLKQKPINHETGNPYNQLSLF